MQQKVTITVALVPPKHKQLSESTKTFTDFASHSGNDGS
ncbi:hypothetical protein B4065_1103 [Caldibacillus thermoamylovorans]|nr:hypothetical protein B4065_1103 [Caldibacillus thermoamylovorans]